MFKCQLCGTQVPRGVPRRLVVTCRRPRVYSAKWQRVRNTRDAREQFAWRELPRSKNGGRVHGKPRFIEILIPQHTGWEIALEKAACPKCAANHSNVTRLQTSTHQTQRLHSPAALPQYPHASRHATNA